MPRTDRLGITISLVMVGLALSISIFPPSREFSFMVLGSELSLRLSGQAQLAFIIAALVCAGVDAIIRTHPLAHRQKLGYTMTFWVLPSLVVISGLILLPGLSWWGYQVLLIIFTGLVLAMIVVAQYRSIDPEDRHQRTARLALNAVVYAIALVWFITLYRMQVRSLISATGVLGVSGLLALELLRIAENQFKRTWLYAFLVSVLMSELTWALNYNSVAPQVGGAVLLLFFYALTGLFQQRLWGRLNRRVVAEFSLIFASGLAILGGFAR